MALKNMLRTKLMIKMKKRILSFLISIFKEIWLINIIRIINIERANNKIKLCTKKVKIVNKTRNTNLEIGFTLCIREVPLI